MNRGEGKNGRLEHTKGGRDGVEVARTIPKKEGNPWNLGHLGVYDMFIHAKSSPSLFSTPINNWDSIVVSLPFHSNFVFPLFDFSDKILKIWKFSAIINAQ